MNSKEVKIIMKNLEDKEFVYNVLNSIDPSKVNSVITTVEKLIKEEERTLANLEKQFNDSKTSLVYKKVLNYTKTLHDRFVEVKKRFDKKSDDSLFLDVDYKEILLIEPKVFNDMFAQLMCDLRDGYYIDKYSSAIDEFFPCEIESLFEKTKFLDNNQLLRLSLLGNDVVKNRLRTLKKGSSLEADLERKFLKKMKSLFQSIKPVSYSDSSIDTKTYYSIMEKLIDKDLNYTYIKKLLEEIDSFKDARNNGSHILMLLLDKFIYNYKLKLANQGFSYVEPSFYKEVIKLFFDKGAFLTDNEKLSFCIDLVNFKDYVIDRSYKDQSLVLDDIDQIADSMDNVSVEEKNGQKGSIIIDEFKIYDVVSGYLRKYSYYSSNDDVTTFMFDDIRNYAFSIGYLDDGSIDFGVHVLDTSSFVELDSDTHNSMKNNNINISLDEKRDYPVISFIYNLQNNRLSNIKVSPSVIRVSHTYQDNDICNYRSDNTLKTFVYMIKKISNELDSSCNFSSQADIKNILTSSISDYIIKIFDSFNIPFIYLDKLDNALELIEENHNAVCDKLFNIPKNEAHKVFDILDKVTDTYYVPSPEENASVDINSDSFIGVYLLKTIRNLQDGTYDIDEEESRVSTYIEELNSEKGYLPRSVIKSNDFKIKRIVRNYKKKK